MVFKMMRRFVVLYLVVGTILAADDYVHVSPTNEDLHTAILSGNETTVLELIRNGTDINGKNEDGFTPLHSAVKMGNVRIVEILIENDANIRLNDQNQETALFIATEMNNWKMVKLLVESGVNVNSINGKIRTPLFIAAEKGFVNIANLLVRNGATVDKEDTYGYTPIYLALKNDHQDIVHLLIFQQILDHQRIYETQSAYNCIITHNNSTDNEEDIFLSKDVSPVEAIGYDCLEKLKTIQGLRILQRAARLGDENIVRTIANDGRGIGRKECYAIHWAVINGYEKLVKMLIDNGIDVNAKWPGHSMHFATPLHRAAMIENVGQVDMVNLLIEKGANIYAEDSDGLSPLDYARRNNHGNVVALLEQHLQQRIGSTQA